MFDVAPRYEKDPEPAHISAEKKKAKRSDICREFCFLCPDAFSSIYLTNDIYLVENYIYIDKTPHRISSAAFRMLCAFNKFKGKTLSREFLLKYSWGGRHKVANNVNVVVSELRMILMNTDIAIITIRGMGYRLISRSDGTE